MSVALPAPSSKDTLPSLPPIPTTENRTSPASTTTSTSATTTNPIAPTTETAVATTAATSSSATSSSSNPTENAVWPGPPPILGVSKSGGFSWGWGFGSQTPDIKQPIFGPRTLSNASINPGMFNIDDIFAGEEKKKRRGGGMERQCQRSMY